MTAAIIMIFLAIGLIPVGVVCSILGFGNIVNGGVYIESPLTFILTAMGVGALSLAGLFVFCAWRLLRT